jgi:hypothetical protein
VSTATACVTSAVEINRNITCDGSRFLAGYAQKMAYDESVNSVRDISYQTFVKLSKHMASSVQRLCATFYSYMRFYIL